jgi:hypothetical protein
LDFQIVLAWIAFRGKQNHDSLLSIRLEDTNGQFSRSLRSLQAKTIGRVNCVMNWFATIFYKLLMTMWCQNRGKRWYISSTESGLDDSLVCTIAMKIPLLFSGMDFELDFLNPCTTVHPRMEVLASWWFDLQVP